VWAQRPYCPVAIATDDAHSYAQHLSLWRHLISHAVTSPFPGYTPHVTAKPKTLSRQKFCIPRSFLVINVCNQGKALCSHCIFLLALFVKRCVRGRTQPYDWADVFWDLQYSLTFLVGVVPKYTNMRPLTAGIPSEKCVVRRFRHCANVIWVYLHKPG
jgi:hypothetical protein